MDWLEGKITGITPHFMGFFPWFQVDFPNKTTPLNPARSFCQLQIPAEHRPSRVAAAHRPGRLSGM